MATLEEFEYVVPNVSRSLCMCPVYLNVVMYVCMCVCMYVCIWFLNVSRSLCMCLVYLNVVVVCMCVCVYMVAECCCVYACIWFLNVSHACARARKNTHTYIHTRTRKVHTVIFTGAHTRHRCTQNVTGTTTYASTLSQQAVE